MKSKSLILSLVILPMLQAQGALIVSYSTASNGGLTYMTPADYHDDVQEPSRFQAAAGSGVAIYDLIAGNGFNISGYGTSIDLAKYVGFKVSAVPGTELTLTDFVFNSAAWNSSATSQFQWGYRIDLNNDGNFTAPGEEWVLDRLYTIADGANLGNGRLGRPKTWDFADIKTTGTVEFGFFASSSDSTEFFRGKDFTLNGSIAAVPEPSTVALGALAGLALLRRRR